MYFYRPLSPDPVNTGVGKQERMYVQYDPMRIAWGLFLCGTDFCTEILRESSSEE